MKLFKENKLTLILGIVYIILMLLLLFGMSTAKYSEVKVVYSSFGAASFNAVILGDSSDGQIRAFEETIDKQDKFYKPGMKYVNDTVENTARVIPFTVANGVAAENVSEVGIDYTVRLRTTGNLPLQYTLISGDVAYKSTTPAAVAVEGKDVNWYEYSFAEETEAGDSEKVFSLPAGTDKQNRPNLLAYKLIVEWPADDDEFDNAVYMKEVEIFQVFVTVSSKNTLDEEHTFTPKDISPEELYGTGLVILGDSSGAVKDKIYDYSYQIDYRSFRDVTIPVSDAAGGEQTFTAYPLVIENGVYKGIENTSQNTYYSVKLKAPYNSLTSSYVYNLRCLDVYDYDSDGNKDEYLTLVNSNVEFRRYDIHTGTYEVLTEDPLLKASEAAEGESGETDPMAARYKYCKVFTFQWDASAPNALNDHYGDKEAIFRLVNTETDISGQVKNTAYSENRFVLSVSAGENGSVSMDPKDAVQNRMEFLIEANFSDSKDASTVTTTRDITAESAD